MQKNSTLIIVFTLLTLNLWAQEAMQKKLQTQMIVAEDGANIDIIQGTFEIKRSLSLENKENVVIKGAGMDKTILNFKNQNDGAEGIRVSNAKNITIQDLTIQDTKGDGIKAMNVDGISFINVKVEWTGNPSSKNGAYGLYPVQCKNVLIEQCIAIGASDAGIYVGQSQDIVVKNNRAFYNVAGIEIENSLRADVYKNTTYNNTGGILIFDLPNLVQKKGGHIRVFDNLIRENNYPNFAPKGNIVAKVPDGTGLMILATNNVEVFNNNIIHNRSAGTAIISYYMTEIPIKDKAYDPYPTGIYIHDNYFERKAVKATSKGRFGKIFMFKLKFGKDVPDILYDGIIDPQTLDERGNFKPEYQICIQNNENASFANMDAENNFQNISRDIKRFDCDMPALNETKVGSDDSE